MSPMHSIIVIQIGVVGQSDSQNQSAQYLCFLKSVRFCYIGPDPCISLFASSFQFFLCSHQQKDTESNKIATVPNGIGFTVQYENLRTNIRTVISDLYQLV